MVVTIIVVTYLTYIYFFVNIAFTTFRSCTVLNLYLCFFYSSYFCGRYGGLAEWSWNFSVQIYEDFTLTSRISAVKIVVFCGWFYSGTSSAIVSISKTCRRRFSWLVWYSARYCSRRCLITWVVSRCSSSRSGRSWSSASLTRSCPITTCFLLSDSALARSNRYRRWYQPVSYTHLTLPTIYSV